MTEGKFDAPKNSPEDAPKSAYDIFREASGAEVADVESIKSLAAEIPELTSDSLAAANEIRKFLIGKGFHYENESFNLQSLARNRKGNCLSFALLFGLLLREKGFNPQYEIVLNPKDAVYEYEEKIFEELKDGHHFEYNKPALPKLSEQAEAPLCRFAPYEHPVLLLDGKSFETTSLETANEDPEWMPPVEFKRAASFEEVASHVYVDKAKQYPRNKKITAKIARELCESALKLAPNNREAYVVLWEIGARTDDVALKMRALEEFRRIGGDDSRFHFDLFEMTGDVHNLDEAIKRAPLYLSAFVERHVKREGDPKEAKFNFAVAAWCAANAVSTTLENFYKLHKPELERLYGKGAMKALRAN
jgi:hypothetical protein